MKEVRTTTEIGAPAARVWQLLSDFERYGEWNPVITRVRGGFSAGAPVDIQLALFGRRVPIKARMLRIEPERDFRWRGPRSRWLARLFHAEHYFSLEQVDEARTRFVHGERFGGALVPLLWPRLEPMLRERYARMNDAVKRRSEAPG